MPVDGVEASRRVSQIGSWVFEARNCEHPVVNKSVDIPAGAPLPEKGWAVHPNDRLGTCEQEREDGENVITICKVARLDFRPRREPRFIDNLTTISCIVRDSDGL